QVTAFNDLAITEHAPSGPPSGISATTNDGPGGSITLTTPVLSLSDGGRVQAGTSGAGAGGNIEINAGSVTLGGGSRFDSSSSGSGPGGAVIVQGQGGAGTSTSSITVAGHN